MNILIIFDSLYGHTEKIAHVMQEELSKDHEARMEHVLNIGLGDLAHVDLVIIGSPTNGGSEMEDIKLFLKKISDNALRGKRTAAFDTSVVKENRNPIIGKIIDWFGHAVNRVEGEMIEKGATDVKKESFFVDGETEMLKEGELERARVWARELVK
ncbi:flavodoxin family protein [Exiguobacterium qingdaonense]|uniref:flavodoxin family protein n=1 Tax=Exiguobacterium qingdaonense TaxID=2751251 RepID=UPI001BE70675|nr:flavodoxin family protein [Exiguobacterium qingdaonense]